MQIRPGGAPLKRIRSVTDQNKIRCAPTVQKSVDDIRERIRNGAFAVGNVLPSETELASLLKVSRGTIRAAIDYLNQSREIVRRPHSRPVVASKSAKSSLTTEVHVWLSNPLANPLSLLTLKGVSLGLKGSPYRMVVKGPSQFVGGVVQAEERQFLQDLGTNPHVAGAIIQRDPFAEDSELIEALVSSGKNLVFLDSKPPAGVEADHVGTANVAVARECVEHLLSLGHTHLAYVCDSEVPPANQDRLAGFWRALEQAGHNVQGDAIVACLLPQPSGAPLHLGGVFALSLDRSPYYHDLASRAVVEILSMNPRPTALFVSHDLLAYWVCAVLEGSGVSVPQDMSVVGFDWIAGQTSTTVDELTSASQDFQGMGRHAADLLLDRFSGRSDSPARHVLLNAPLVIRSSTAHYNHLSAMVQTPALGNQADLLRL